VDEVCSIPSCPSDIGDKPLLYPLHIISDTSEHQAEPVVPSFDSALSPACGHTGAVCSSRHPHYLSRWDKDLDKGG